MKEKDKNKTGKKKHQQGLNQNKVRKEEKENVKQG